MNETDLDRLLNTWEAPAPPASLRQGLRMRFPRAERRSFARPLRWAFVLALASAVLAIGIDQSDNAWDFRLVRVFNRYYELVIEGFEAWRATSIVTQIRQSEPKVYVDGQLVAHWSMAPAAG